MAATILRRDDQTDDERLRESGNASPNGIVMNFDHDGKDNGSGGQQQANGVGVTYRQEIVFEKIIL